MNIFSQGWQFLKEAYYELKKVTWLSRKEVIGSTVAIIILVALIAVFVGTADFFLSKFLSFVL